MVREPVLTVRMSLSSIHLLLVAAVMSLLDWTQILKAPELEKARVMAAVAVAPVTGAPSGGQAVPKVIWLPTQSGLT